jgi:PAS domain S-box-containing protein
MPPLRKQVRIVSVFGLLAILLLANAAVTRSRLAVQIDKRNAVARSNAIVLQISEALSSLKDAETGQRGYLLTNNPTYLEPYTQSIAEVRSHIDRLQELANEESEQNPHIQEFRSLADSKLAELAQTIELQQSGRSEEAKSTVLTHVGKRTMDQLRAVAELMWSTERVSIQRGEEEYRRAARVTAFSIYAATFLGIVAVFMVARYMLHDLRQREAHAAALRDREEWFRVTLGSVGDGVIATDRGSRVLFVNEVASRLTGFSQAEASNRPIHEVFPIFNENTRVPVENPVARVLEEGKTVGLANHTVLKHTNGQYIPIEDSAAPIRNDANQIIGVVLVFRDATHERQSQDMLRRAEKLAAAGRLAATMAHEINNPLEAVGNLIYIVKSSSEIHPDTRVFLDQAERQLERVSHITRQTLGFYREAAKPGAVDLASVVGSVLALYENKLRNKNVTVRCDVQSAPLVNGLVGEFRQLFANLVSNAIDAVQIGGSITISGRPAQVNGSHGAEVRITDDGAGIPAEHSQRIFEPFFTTKADVGTGLGLWVAREIAERHGGYVQLVRNSNTPGTTFSIFLPSHTAASAAAR